jgi:hypothetical protein
VDDTGECFCIECNTHSFIADCSFKCDDINHGTEYVKFSIPDLADALRKLQSIDTGDIEGDDEKLDFIVNIVNNVSKRYRYLRR